MCTVSDDPVQRRGNHLEQREKLGLNSAPKARSNSRTPHPEPTNALQKVEVCSCDLGQNREYCYSSPQRNKKFNKEVLQIQVHPEPATIKHAGHY